MREKKRKAFQEVQVAVAAYQAAKERLHDFTENDRATEMDYLRLIDDAISKAERARELGAEYNTTSGTFLSRRHGARQWHRWFTDAIAELQAMRSTFEIAHPYRSPGRTTSKRGSPGSHRRLSSPTAERF